MTVAYNSIFHLFLAFCIVVDLSVKGVNLNVLLSFLLSFS